MFLIDTNVISEARKGLRADPGVRAFWADAASNQNRGDRQQAHRLEAWLAEVLDAYGDRVLAFDAESAHLWGVCVCPISAMLSISRLLRSLCCTTSRS